MSKRGRKPVSATEAQRREVADLLEKKTPVARIAVLLAMSAPTFRKLFSAELLSRKEKLAGAKAPVDFPYPVTKVHRDKVVLYIGYRMPVALVAKTMRCTVEQLKAAFAEEIEIGEADKRAKVLERLDEQSAGGNVSATKHLEQLTAAPEGPAVLGGKKAQATAAAQEAVEKGGKFVPMAPPKLIVDNTA